MAAVVAVGGPRRSVIGGQRSSHRHALERRRSGRKRSSAWLRSDGRSRPPNGPSLPATGTGKAAPFQPSAGSEYCQTPAPGRVQKLEAREYRRQNASIAKLSVIDRLPMLL